MASISCINHSQFLQMKLRWAILHRNHSHGLIQQRLSQISTGCKTGVFNLLSSSANLHLSYNPAGRSHCRLQNHHGYIKHLHRGMGGSPGDVGEVPMTQAEPHSPTLTSLHLRHSSFSNTSAALPTSQLILQPFRCFTYLIGTSSTSQLILQPFRRFTYITAHFTTLPLFHLRHSSFSNPSARFIYATAHSTTLPPLHLRHRSFYSPSVASPTSQTLHVLHLESCPCIGG